MLSGIASDVEAALGDLLHVHVVDDVGGRVALHAQPLRRALTFRPGGLRVWKPVRTHVTGIPSWLGGDIVLLLRSAVPWLVLRQHEGPASTWPCYIHT